MFITFQKEDNLKVLKKIGCSPHFKITRFFDINKRFPKKIFSSEKTE